MQDEIDKTGWHVRSWSIQFFKLAFVTLITPTAVYTYAPVTFAQFSDPSTESVAASQYWNKEIVVTARRREELLQTVPVAVTVLLDQELGDRNLTNLMEIGAYVPNTVTGFGQVGSGSGSIGQVYIRGVGQVDYLPTTDPGVAIYVDGVYYPRALGSVLDLNDLERIEILRGPQGTLFGKNAIGGAINILTKKPSNAFNGSGELVAGKYDRLDVNAAVNFPVIKDNLFTRIAFSSRQRDPYATRNDFDTDAVIDEDGDIEQTGGRVALRWLPANNTTVDLQADYSRDRSDTVPTSLLQFDDAGEFGGLPIQLWNALVGAPSGRPMSSDFITVDEDKSYGTGPNGNSLETWGTDLTVNVGLDSISIKSVTAYREMDAETGIDSDASPLAVAHNLEQQEQSQFSQEIHLFGSTFNQKLDWLVGFFFFDESAQDTNEARFLVGLYDALETLPGQLDGSPCAPPFSSPGCSGNPINTLLDLDLDVFNKIDITSYAIFTQATYALSNSLKLSAGIRYSYDEKDYTMQVNRVASNTTSIPLTTIGSDWSEITPMASLDYQWTEELLVYVSAAKGYKSGGFNGRPIGSIAEAAPYDPETLWSYELGMKSEWFDRRILLNATAFYYDYTDMQFAAAAADPDSGALVIIVDNVGESEAVGIELEGLWQPTDSIRLGAQLGYIDFDITSLDPNAAGITLDSKQPRTPEWTAGASAEYLWPLSSTGQLGARLDWAYESKSFPTIQNIESIARDEYHLLNARLSYQILDSGWEFALFGTNLLDERVVISGSGALDVTGIAEGFYNRPREWGLSARKTFGN